MSLPRQQPQMSLPQENQRQSPPLTVVDRTFVMLHPQPPTMTIGIKILKGVSTFILRVHPRRHHQQQNPTSLRFLRYRQRKLRRHRENYHPRNRLQEMYRTIIPRQFGPLRDREQLSRGKSPLKVTRHQLVIPSVLPPFRLFPLGENRCRKRRLQC